MKIDVYGIQSNDREIVARAVHELPTTECASGDVLCFTHQRKTIVLCLDFKNGGSAVDENKVRYVDSLNLTKEKIWVLETLGTQETDIRYSTTRKPSH